MCCADRHVRALLTDPVAPPPHPPSRCLLHYSGDASELRRAPFSVQSGPQPRRTSVFSRGTTGKSSTMVDGGVVIK
jgi:hypothetical protein